MGQDCCSTAVEFQDFLPTMAERLGVSGLMDELCKGFCLLMDSERGLITFDSLKKNAARLGLGAMSDDLLWGMLTAGDTNGDGAMSQMEFCVLMIRLSPDLMERAEELLEKALQKDIGDQDIVI